MNVVHKVDALLNRYTMYRVLLYTLAALLATAFILAAAGLLGISAPGLAANTAVLLAASYCLNRLLAHIFKVDTNNESWLLTALILAFIVPPSTNGGRLVAVAATAVFAIAAKFILTWRHTPVFNPAAIAALAAGVSGVLPATWWVGSPAMAVPLAIAAVFLLRKQRKFSMFLVFFLAAYLTYIVIRISATGTFSTVSLSTLLLSWPLLFLGSVMLTEPSTLPQTRYLQLLYAILVGTVFTAQLRVGRLSTTPELALITGNLFSLLLGGRFAEKLVLKRRNQLAPAIFELVFARPESLRFAAGQYMEWTVGQGRHDSRGNRRSFSIASAPAEREIRLAYKLSTPSSTFKRVLQTLEPGQVVRGARPSGDFLLPADTSLPVVMIAGGIGITPYRSMIMSLIDKKQTRSITLFYLAQKNEFVYRSEFDQAKHYGLTVHYVNQKLKPADLRAALDITKRKPEVYISGPPAMVRFYSGLLSDLGVARGSIRTDYFAGY